MSASSSCIDCTFWSGDRKDDKSSGACKRFPVQVAGIVPQQNMMGQTVPGVISAWPACKGSEWCGEFKEHSRLELQ